MLLYELLDLDELSWLCENGYVDERTHPTEPLGILNYSDRAQVHPELFQQFESLNHCRGLIYNTDTGEIVARPWRKFWNYGQPGSAQIPLDAQVQVTDKKDGSLGILYRVPIGDSSMIGDTWAVATRGSFTSDQALHATQVVQTKYKGWTPTDDTTTLLFEIVYKDNRIVLDYGDMDDLILLGSVDIEDGHTVGPEIAQADHRWPGPAGETLYGGPFKDALELNMARPNREGYVIRRVGKHPNHGDMVKLKQVDYLALHRLIFSTSDTRLWEALAVHACKDLIDNPKHWGSYLGIDPAQAEKILAAGPDWLEALADGVPDEFFAEVKARAETIRLRAETRFSLGNIRASVLRTHIAYGQTTQREAYESLAGNPLQMEIMRQLKDPTRRYMKLKSWRLAGPEDPKDELQERER